MPLDKTVKVAVVGSGLAGLTTSYLLSQPTAGQKGKKVEVHLFEKADEIGMDCSSISIPLPGSKSGEWRIDVPMRSFQGGYYRNVIALYKRLNVAFREENFSYSFSFLTASRADGRPAVTATALYNGANGTQGVSKPSILDGPPRSKNDGWSSPWVTLWGTALFVLVAVHLGMCYTITLWHSLPYFRSRRLSTMTLGEWVERAAPTGRVAKFIGLDVAWQDYVKTILVPLMSAMCTAPEEDVYNHPVEEILDYIWLGLGQTHYTLANGVQDVVGPLSSGLDETLHLGSSIVALRPDTSDPRLISIECLDKDGNRSTHDGFHHIVLATQASRAIPLLGGYARSLPAEATRHKNAVEEQMRCLKTFKYCTTVVVNHTDDTLLPSEPRDRRDLNLISSSWDEPQESELCVASTYTMTTHILPRPVEYPSFLPSVYQTTNPFVPPRKDTVLSVSSLERAVLTPESKQAVRELCKPRGKRWWECPTEVPCELGSLQGAGRRADINVPGIWICGSYAYLGVPLLEGCVVSARNVVEQGILESEGLRLAECPW